MNNQHRSLEKMWAYLHGELAGSERAEMEAALQKDETMRADMEILRQMDHQLKEIMPLTEQSAEELERSVLSAWETSQPPQQVRLESISKLDLRTAWVEIKDKLKSWFILEQPQWTLALAVAACLLLAIGIQSYLAGFMTWSGEAQLATYRGGEPGAATSAYRREDLLALSSLLEQAVRRELKQAGLARERRWAFHAFIQELDASMVQVQIQLSDRNDPAYAREWSETFADAGALAAAGPDLARRMVGDLKEAP